VEDQNSLFCIAVIGFHHKLGTIVISISYYYFNIEFLLNQGGTSVSLRKGVERAS